MTRLLKRIILIGLFGLLVTQTALVDAQELAAARLDRKLYLPLVQASMPPPLPPIMLGVYTDSWLGDDSTINNEVKAIDAWAGKKNSLVGTFIAIEDPNEWYNIPVPLGKIADAGYTPFVNLETTRTLDQINNGSLDAEIIQMAKAFKTWRSEGAAKGQDRRAFLAPLQEMNGDWVSYHSDDTQKFKNAYMRIQNIFAQQGASSAVWWVFAPNGWSDPDKNDPPFEQYYPGDDKVDALAFSSYNFGYCSAAAWKQWDNAKSVYREYLERMQVMAPRKGVIVAQTGTSAYTAGGYSVPAKSSWLDESYQFMAEYSNVIGVIYFNKGMGEDCDWPFYKKDGVKADGYISGIRSGRYQYVSPKDLIAKGP